MSSMEREKELARRLLLLAKSSGDSPEGRSAREKANARLRSLGLSEADVLTARRMVCEGRQSLWRRSLLEACSALHPEASLEFDRGSYAWFFVGSEASVSSVEQRFFNIETQISEKAESYVHRLRKRFSQYFSRDSDEPAILKSRRIFVDVVVLAVLSRLSLEVVSDSPAKPSDESPPVGSPPPSKMKSGSESLIDKIQKSLSSESPLDGTVASDLDPFSSALLDSEKIQISPPWKSFHRRLGPPAKPSHRSSSPSSLPGPSVLDDAMEYANFIPDDEEDD